ncbi:unnamed protein product [Hyaloperonospora brassicae]|uniref:TFIIS N-terminal domain-containing protein n=1 Tax=Hyaloperonospora brassicae TaxID=162125 RepID=A0AAV0TWL5_HYABA|nr:unnamed protein product [Hyaloperonospora brassicae]
MDHVETQDPFGFVGSHVVRKEPRTGKEEHGWLTRFDDALDCYTLFVPGGGEPMLLSRGEVMKFLSAPNIELHDDDHDTFPPPVKDTTTSRYVGVQLSRPRQGSSGNDKRTEGDVRGRVKCFLPFGDRYSVEYEDGSTDEILETAVIDGMIALIKSSLFSSSSRPKCRSRCVKRRKSGACATEGVHEPVRRKRQRATTTRNSDASDISPGSVHVAVKRLDDPHYDVVYVDLTEAGVDRETEPAPNILDVMTSTAKSTTRENSLEMASHPPDELMHVDEDEVADKNDIVKVQKRQDEADGSNLVVTAPQADTARPETQKASRFYVVDAEPHVAIEPLPNRVMAFEFLRVLLLRLLDGREACEVKTTLQCELLRNLDVRPHDAVIRFTEADGLHVLNHLLNAFATKESLDSGKKKLETGDLRENMRERMERDGELLEVLKVVAMLPTPSRGQVIASDIGKTINVLSKARGPSGDMRALPTCITALAKWIKTSWIKNIPASKNVPKASVNAQQSASRPQQQARRGGRGGYSGRPSFQSNRQQAPQKGYNAPRDSTPPMPKHSQSKQTTHPQLPKAASAPTQLPVSRRARSSLKPDWMRQKEELSRSRFCIDDSKNVDTRLYRDERAHRPRNMPGMAPSSQVISQQTTSSDQHEDAGGPDGVFGRPQKLRFGKRWSTQEFRLQDPPDALRQAAGYSYARSPYGRSQYSEHFSVRARPVPYSSRRPRPILRPVSRYKDEPVIDSASK